MTQEQRARDLIADIFGKRLLEPCSLRVARINALIDALENLRVQAFVSMWREEAPTDEAHE